jgi:hypothetical protein
MERLTKRVDFIQNYLDAIFSEDLHAKRVKSLTDLLHLESPRH